MAHGSVESMQLTFRISANPFFIQGIFIEDTGDGELRMALALLNGTEFARLWQGEPGVSPVSVEQEELGVQRSICQFNAHCERESNHA